MNFLHPQFLYYMILPLIIFFILIVTQRNKQMSFFSNEVLRRLSVNGKYLSFRTRNIIYFFIFLFLIITLAQPVISDGKVKIQAKSADIILALDMSTSMLAKDVYPNRLKMAQYKMLKFIKLFFGDKIGVIAFAKNTFLVSPLSYDHSAVSFLLKHLQPTLATQSGVNFGQLLYSTNRISKSKNSKYLIIFTNGGHQNSFKNEIKYAKRHHIIIFILGIGKQKGIPIPTQKGFLTYNGHIVITKLNTKISNLATQTGGVYIHSVLSNEDVIKMVQEVSSKAKGQFLKSHIITHYIPLFYAPLVLALLLLLIAMGSINKIKNIKKFIPFLIITLFIHAISLHAQVFTATILKDANQAYHNHQYAKSSKLFKKYYQQNHNNNVRYDLGNALYKDKKYNQAIKKYETIHFSNKIKKANVLYNLANTYAKKGDIKSLKHALKLYEKSLKLRKDSDTIHNIHVVKERLKKKHHKNSKQHKQNKNSNKKQNKQNKNTNKNKKQNGNKQKQKNNQINNHKNSQQKRQSQQQKSNNKEAEQSKTLAKYNKKIKQQKVMKHGISQPKSNTALKNKMSKKEIKQWLKQIEYKTSTHIYQLKQMKTNMEDYNNEPW